VGAFNDVYGAGDWQVLVYDVSFPPYWRLDSEGKSYKCRKTKILGFKQEVAEQMEEPLAIGDSVLDIYLVFRIFYGEAICHFCAFGSDNTSGNYPGYFL
jgi:hypothetical protein